MAKERYRKISVRMWNDRDFNSLSNDAKLIWVYILTCPAMLPFGAMKATQAGMAEELGMEAKAFREAFREVLAKGLAKYCPKACCLVVPKFIQHNMPESPNVLVSWRESVHMAPECDLLDSHMSLVGQQVKGLPKAFGEAFAKAFPIPFAKAMPNQEQEQEQEQEEEKTPDPPVAIATAGHAPLKAEPKPDPLLSYPRLTGSYTRIREKLVEIHPKAKVPTIGTAKEWADRNTLAQLVRIDGYSEAEVLETMKWIFTGESRDAEFWRSQFRSVSWLRKTSDGATRFTKAHDLRIKEEGKAEASTIDPLTQQLLDQIDGRAA